MIDFPSGPVKPGPSRITAFGARIDSAKYSAGCWPPMPVSSGPTFFASPSETGKVSPWIAWHLWHSRSTKTCRPFTGSPPGSANFQPRGTPPDWCSSSIVTFRDPAGAAGFVFAAGCCIVPCPSCCARAPDATTPSAARPTAAPPTTARTARHLVMGWTCLPPRLREVEPDGLGLGLALYPCCSERPTEPRVLDASEWQHRHDVVTCVFI